MLENSVHFFLMKIVAQPTFKLKSGCETQNWHHQEPKTRVSMGTRKWLFEFPSNCFKRIFHHTFPCSQCYGLHAPPGGGLWPEDTGVGDRVPGSQCAEPEGHVEDDVQHILPDTADTNLPETWDRQGDHVQVTYLFATSVADPEGGAIYTSS